MTHRRGPTSNSGSLAALSRPLVWKNLRLLLKLILLEHGIRVCSIWPAVNAESVFDLRLVSIGIWDPDTAGIYSVCLVQSLLIAAIWRTALICNLYNCFCISSSFYSCALFLIRTFFLQFVSLYTTSLVLLLCSFFSKHLTTIGKQAGYVYEAWGVDWSAWTHASTVFFAASNSKSS